MKYFKKGGMIANYKVDETWEEVNEEVIPTEFGLKLKSQTMTTEFQNKLKIKKYNDEINKLIMWFETEYKKNEQKYRRLNTLNLLCDDGTRPYDKLIDLYNEAETKRKRIQELEVLINE